MATPKAKAGGVVVAGILSAIFFLEGGYVNNPKDPGGETNFGVTKKVAEAHGYKGSMKDLPKDFAEQIFYEDYIVKPGFLPMVELSPAVTEELVDTGVNTGASRSARWFQESLNSLSRGGRDYSQISVDGNVGDRTIASYRSLRSVRGGVKACELMLKTLDAKQANHYLNLTSLSTFTVGWIDHRIGNVPISKCKLEK